MSDSMNIKRLIKIIADDNNVDEKIFHVLHIIMSKTKSNHLIEELYNQSDALNSLIGLLNKKDGKYNSLVLSILANCANIHQQTRKDLLEMKLIPLVANLMEKINSCEQTSRAIRLLSNLSKDPVCLEKVQEKNVIDLIIRHGCCVELKCQTASLRALRIICVTKKSSKFAAENDQFPNLLAYMHSSNQNAILLTLRMLCGMLKSQSTEVFYRAVEESTLQKVIQLSSVECYCEVGIEILFLLTLNSGCRVGVAMEGGIEVFIDRIKKIDHSDTFKYATQGLCLCAREAVSRNRMKTAGVLPWLVNILQHDDYIHFHESIVAAFVWFLFDDSSLGLLIRANTIPALLKYLDRLTYIEYCQNQDNNEESDDKNTADMCAENDLKLKREYDDTKKSELLKEKTGISQTSIEEDISRQLWCCSSPESSPYNPQSPHYSIPSYSPNISPSYSPPMSPSISSPQNSPEQDFSDIYHDNASSPSNSLPYHYQSADGRLSMIHGTRGPIHDILLLLSRFSQARDPSTFFLDLPGFNSLNNYLLLSFKPNPKCARILNRLTLNSHCFDVLIKQRLIPRLYLRLCTGWSLEMLSILLNKAREKMNKDTLISSPDLTDCVDFGYLNITKMPSKTTYDWGKFLISNLRSQSESSYGKGVFSHIFLTGSMELKERCVVSLPHVVWSNHLQRRVYLELKAIDILMKMLEKCEKLDGETFVLLVEALCALSRMNGISTEHFTLQVLAILQPKDDKNFLNSNTKRQKLDQNIIRLKMSSGKVFECEERFLNDNSNVFSSMFSAHYTDFLQPHVSIIDIDENAFEQMLHFLCGCSIRLDEYPSCLNPEVCKVKTKYPTKTDNCFDLTSINAKELETNLKDKKSKTITTNLCIKQEKSETFITNSYKQEEKDQLLQEEKEIITTNMYKQDCTQIEPLCNVPIGTLNTQYASALLICSDRYLVDDLKNQCEKYLMCNIHDKNVVDLMLLAIRHRSNKLLKQSLAYLLSSCECPLLRSQNFAELLYSSEKLTFIDNIKCLLTNAVQGKENIKVVKRISI